jgi:hypothetical protein
VHTYNLKGVVLTQTAFLYDQLFKVAENGLTPNIKLVTALRGLEIAGAPPIVLLPQHSKQNLVRLCADSLVASQCVYVWSRYSCGAVWGCVW